MSLRQNFSAGGGGVGGEGKGEKKTSVSSFHFFLLNVILLSQK